MNYVGISRRYFALLLDLFFLGFALEGLYNILFNPAFNSLAIKEGPVKYVYGSFYATIFIFDQIISPVLYGTTFTRWICGYRIKTKDGKNPTLLRSLVRFFSFWIIGTLFLGLITFITSLFRKDKAAIHDLISGTYGVYPENRHKNKAIRITALTILLLFLMMVFLNVLTLTAYRIFVKPTRTKLAATTGQLYLPQKMNSERPQGKSIRFINVDLFQIDGSESIDICKGETTPDGQEYVMTVNGSKFSITYSVYDDVFWGKYMNKLKVGRLITPMLKTDLFLDQPVLIAEKTINNDKMYFPFFSPINNLAYLGAGIYSAIEFPGYLAGSFYDYYTLKGNNFYGFLALAHRDRASIIWIKIYRNNGLEEYRIISKGSTAESREISNKIFNEAHVIEGPMSVEKTFPDCQTEPF